MARPWLRGLGITPDERSLAERIYWVYLALLGMAVVLLWGSGALALAEQAHLQLSPAVRRALLSALPGGIFVGQVLVLMVTLSSSPFKLTFADMAYVAGSPMYGAAPVLVSFLTRQVRNLALIVPAAALTGVVLAGVSGLPDVRIIALHAVVAAVLLALLSWAVSWGPVSRGCCRPGCASKDCSDWSHSCYSRPAISCRQSCSGRGPCWRSPLPVIRSPGNT